MFRVSRKGLDFARDPERGSALAAAREIEPFEVSDIAALFNLDEEQATNLVSSWLRAGVIEEVQEERF